MQKFSNDSSIINFVHSLLVIAPRKGEEFDFSVSSDVYGMHINKYLDILEIISDCRSDPFTLIDLELSTNSYMIACTDTQGFEEGENYASTISVEHTLGYDIEFIGSDLILLGSRVQELSLLFVTVLINFGVKNQVPKISFKISARDLM